MIIIKNSEQIAMMKKAGRITAEALLVAKEAIRPGVSTKEIDTKIHDFIKRCGAVPSTRATDLSFLLSIIPSRDSGSDEQ